MAANGDVQVGHAEAGTLSARVREHSLKVTALTEQMREEASALTALAAELEDYVCRQHDALRRLGAPIQDGELKLPRVLQGGPAKRGEGEAQE